MVIKFTNTEAEIIAHRLSVLCDAQTLADIFLDWSGEDAEKAAVWASEALTALDSGERELEVGEAEAEILADCIEGTTFFENCDDAILLGTLTQQKVAAYHRAVATVGRKIGTILNREVSVP